MIEIDVLEQEVYGVDVCTYNILICSMPTASWPVKQKQNFIKDMFFMD